MHLRGAFFGCCCFGLAISHRRRGQAENRLRVDIVAAGYRAQRFAVHVAPSDRLGLLVRGESGLAAKFDALGFGVGPASGGAFEDTAAFQLRGDAENRKDDLGKVRGCIEKRLGNRTDARPGFLHLAGDDEQVGRVARQAVNSRGYHHVVVSLAFATLLEIRPARLYMQSMAIVKVYQWKTFNISTNESVNSQHMATRAAIKAFVNSAPIEATEIEIDEAELDGNGIWTPPGRR
jgi:hypothetical protein